MLVKVKYFTFGKHQVGDRETCRVIREGDKVASSLRSWGVYGAPHITVDHVAEVLGRGTVGWLQYGQASGTCEYAHIAVDFIECIGIQINPLDSTTLDKFVGIGYRYVAEAAVQFHHQEELDGMCGLRQVHDFVEVASIAEDLCNLFSAWGGDLEVIPFEQA